MSNGHAGRERRLIFENGAWFLGRSFGAVVDTVAEVVVYGSMVGYQEMMTDPASLSQMALMTYPLIGSYGLTDEDDESRRPCLSGMIVRKYNDHPTNYRYAKTLSDVMFDHGIAGLQGVDTRQIARMIAREGKAMRAILTDPTCTVEEGIAKIGSTPIRTDLVKSISCKRPWFARTSNARYNVVALDLGIKQSIIQHLSLRGCNVIVMPYDTPLVDVMAMNPEGILIPDGPGAAADVPEAIELVRAVRGQIPILGISLGHQVIALAQGATLSRMPRPHRGGNHPVRNLASGRVDITAQNHALTVEPDSLEGTGLSVSHVNLIDGTIEGFMSDDLQILSMQFNPESAPGPRDSGYLFDQFIKTMEMRQEVSAHA